MGWIHLAEDIDQWRAFVIAVIFGHYTRLAIY
jgi:hypothetical protein